MRYYFTINSLLALLEKEEAFKIRTRMTEIKTNKKCDQYIVLLVRRKPNKLRKTREYIC